MEIPVEQFIPSGAGFLATIVSLAGMWFKFQAKVERLEEDKLDLKRQIEGLGKSFDTHEKEAIEMREHFNSQLSEFKGSLLVNGEQFKQILAMLQDIKDRITALENGKR